MKGIISYLMLISVLIAAVCSFSAPSESFAMDPNVLVGRWRVEYEDGKTGWLTLRPRDNHGHLTGRLYVPKSIIDYPPNQKRRGRDYNNNVFASTPGTINLGMEFTLYHESHPNPRSGQGFYICSLVADGVVTCRTLNSEKGGRILRYPGTGFPFQFMGSGNFTATK